MQTLTLFLIFMFFYLFYWAMDTKESIYKGLVSLLYFVIGVVIIGFFIWGVTIGLDVAIYSIFKFFKSLFSSSWR